MNAPCSDNGCRGARSVPNGSIVLRDTMASPPGGSRTQRAGGTLPVLEAGWSRVADSRFETRIRLSPTGKVWIPGFPLRSVEP